MRDFPGILLVATIWAYWFGVGAMIARVRRETHTLAGLVPEQRQERWLWLLWVPLVAAFDPEGILFENVNTPTDYAEARRRIKS